MSSSSQSSSQAALAEASKEIFLRRASRGNLAEWCRLCGYTPARHHLLICDELEALSAATSIAWRYFCRPARPSRPTRACCFRRGSWASIPTTPSLPPATRTSLPSTLGPPRPQPGRGARQCPRRHCRPRDAQCRPVADAAGRTIFRSRGRRRYRWVARRSWSYRRSRKITRGCRSPKPYREKLELV